MKIYIYIIAAFSLVACSPGSNEDYLTELTTKRDSIKEQYQKLGTELSKIELEIAQLDTSKRLVNVTVQQAVNEKFEHFFKVYGGVNADNNTTLFPTASGDVVSLKVEEGQHVKKGQLLFKIDSEILENTIEEVKTQRSLVEDIYTKQKSLWDKNIGSEMDYLRAKNNLESIDNKLVTLNSQLQQTNVTAPFSGTIDEIFIKTGQLVTPQIPTLRIVNLDKVYLKAEIPENYIKVISKGSPVKLHFPSINLEMDTHIDETGKYINPENRTFTVKVDIENNNNLLYPNLLGMLEIQDYGNDSAIVIPARLIQEDANGNSFIFIAVNQEEKYTSEIRKIKVGMTYQGFTEVISGLQIGEMVIDKGSRNVSNGQFISIIE